MQVIIAHCSVTYAGRGDTLLGAATRAIIIKSDGSVSVHNDLSNKPLNYMGAGNIHTVTVNEAGEEVWSFDLRKENLTVTLHEVVSRVGEVPLDTEEKLTRDGTEAHLQAWLAENPEQLGAGFELVQREFRTTAGAVDILAVDPEGRYVAVEVKRVAMLPAVDQTRRYVEALRPELGEDTYGLLVALDVRPKTRELADKRGLSWLEVDYTPQNLPLTPPAL